jgi:glucose uptake protein GlcU
MNLVILLGVLAPIIYLMVKVVSNTVINKKITLNTIVIAMIGMLLAAIVMVIVNKPIHLFYYIVASIFVGIIWGIILCGCCLFYQKLNNAFSNKKKDM